MTTRTSMLDHAAEVARQLESFGAYRRSLATARRALRRRAPGFTNEQYDSALSKARELVAVAREIVAANEGDLMALSRARGTTWGTYPGILRDAVPGFPTKTYVWMIGWVVFWYHLK